MQYPGQYGTGYPQQGGFPGAYGAQPNQSVWGQRTPWYAMYYNQVPPHLHQQIQGWFYAIDTDRNGTLDQNELGRALAQAQILLQPDVLWKLMMVFDLDRSGTIGINEFISLYQFITNTRNSFGQFDRDRSGFLDWNELAQALAVTGFQLSPQSIQGLMYKFDPTRTGRLSIDGYTNLCIYLANMRSFFDNKRYRSNTPVQPGAYGETITLTFDELVGGAPYFA